MTTNNKTIKINTEYFTNIGGKTKKNREKQNKLLTQKPIINPNSLKRQLLNRVKEHKNREKKELEDSRKQNKIKSVDSNKGNESTNFSDELYESMNYLSVLSKKHKEDSDKKKYLFPNLSLSEPKFDDKFILFEDRISFILLV